MTMGKLQAIRAGAAKVETTKTTGKILPDLTNPPVDNLPTTVPPLSAQTAESRAKHMASFAVCPDMPATVTTNEQASAWYAALTPQQQAAYQFEQLVETDLDHADTISTIPLRWYFTLVKVYTDANGKCTLDDFPVPDSDKGNNPAITKEPGRNKAGKPATITVDFYDVFARDLNEGKALRADIESLQAAAPKSGASIDKVLPKHRMLTDDARQSQLNTANQRWSRFRTSIKDAIWIRVTWAAIKGLANVELDYVYDVEFDDNGKEVSRTVTTTSTPFAIWAKGNDALKFTYTVNNFLKLDPAYAATKGGTLKALRDGSPAEPKVPTAKQGVVTASTIEPVIAELAAFIKQDKNAAALLTKAVAPIGSAEALSDDYVLSLGKVVLGLDGIWKHIKDRYTALVIKAEQDATKLVKQQAENVGA